MLFEKRDHYYIIVNLVTLAPKHYLAENTAAWFHFRSDSDWKMTKYFCGILHFDNFANLSKIVTKNTENTGFSCNVECMY